MTTTPLIFHDISNHDGEYNGTGPLFAKATEGVKFVDVQYARNRDRTVGRGDPFAAYHYLRPGLAADQAKHAFDVIGDRVCAMLDTERTIYGAPSYRDAMTFTETYLGLGGFMRPLYLPRWYWSSAWKATSLKAFADLGLWLISSNYTTYTDSGPGWGPYGGMTPLVWQFRGGPLDTDAFRGTKTALGKLLLPFHAPATPPPPSSHAPGSRLLVLTDPPMTGPDVKFIQEFIGPEECGPADGVYGPHTVQGVKWYQAMRGAKGGDVDGKVGRWTWGQMGIEFTGK
jgi:hypothetical protein